MRKLSDVLDECLEKHEEDLKAIVYNLIHDALSGKKWAIELVVQYVIKPLLDSIDCCAISCCECADISDSTKTNH